MKRNTIPLILALLSLILIQACKKSDGGTRPDDKNATAVKWHPGHYYTLVGGGIFADDYLQNVYNELDTTPALQGLQVRYSWRTLEPEKDKYDFTPIDKILEKLATRNRRMIILFSLKSFTPDIGGSPVPGYVFTDEYAGGVQGYTAWNDTEIKGYVIKLWNEKVYSRLTLLLKKLGERYNANPHFEGIGFTETVFSVNGGASDGFPGMATYHDRLLKLNRDLKLFFPNCLTNQFANYPRDFLGQLTSNLKEIGSGFGGPDILPTDGGLTWKNNPKGAYLYYPELSGIIPLLPSVQHSNYRNTQADGGGYQPTLINLLKYGRDTLYANYMFWTRDVQFYKQVLALLNQAEQKNSAAGGLKTDCPSVYKDCDTR